MFHSKADDRQYGGNEGYPDRIDTSYEYDRLVANSRQVAVGDLIFLRNGDSIVGMANIDTIAVRNGVKVLNRCISCKKTGIKKRKTMTPTYRCHQCGEVFDDPVIEEKECQLFRAEYRSSFVPLSEKLPGESSFIGDAKQNSIRELFFPAALRILEKLKPSSFRVEVGTEQIN